MQGRGGIKCKITCDVWRLHACLSLKILKCSASSELGNFTAWYCDVHDISKVSTVPWDGHLTLSA